MPDRRYQWLLRLLPPSFREDHGTELLQVWRDERRDATADGARRRWCGHWMSAARDTVRVAPREHAATAVRNLRFAVRRLRRAPAFTITAILTLALGTGATASVFSLVNAVLLRPLPWRSPDAVGLIWPIQPSGERTWLSFPEIEELQRDLTTVSGVAGFTDVRPTLVSNGTGTELQALAVSHNFFALLGVSPVAGRDFTRADDRPGATPVVILSHAFWRAQFASDPNIVGRAITVDTRSYTVIGVLAPDFAVLQPSSVLPARVDIWLPLEPHLASRDRGIRFLHAVARVRDRDGFARTGDELRAYASRVQRAFASTYQHGEWSFTIVPFKDDVVSRVRVPLYLLLGLVSLVLVMACSNVASLLLVRGEARQSELALRTALGAGPVRLAGELFAETLVLASAGGAIGLVLASSTPALLRSLDPAALPRLNDTRVDLTVVGFMGSLVLLTATVFTAVQRRSRMRPGLRLGRPLVVVQTALATTVLITSLFVTEAFGHLQSVDLGFQSERVLTGRVTLSSKYPPGPEAARFFERATAEVARVPGVSAAAAITQLPLSGAMLGSTFLTEPNVAPRRIDADLRGITPTYFDVMSIVIRQGRAFTDDDTVTSVPVAIVDESFARRLNADGRVVGQHIRWFRQPTIALEIIGIVADVRHRGPGDDARETVYRPYRQYPRSSMFLTVKTATAAPLSPQIRAALASVDPTQPFADVMTMDARLERSVSRARTSLMLASVLAVIALTLGVIGLYGVLSVRVARRTREFGIRIALGATPASVRGHVLKEGLTLTIIGAAIGVAGAVVVVRLAETMLYGTGPGDVRPYAIAVVVILLSSAVAYWLPARRARDTDVSVTLRAQ
jgi:putative ABC transport system permease protein